MLLYFSIVFCSCQFGLNNLPKSSIFEYADYSTVTERYMSSAQASTSRAETLKI